MAYNFCNESFNLWNAVFDSSKKEYKNEVEWEKLTEG